MNSITEVEVELVVTIACFVIAIAAFGVGYVFGKADRINP